MLSKESIIGVIGSGAMGSGIAQVAATAKHRVFVYDSNGGALANASKGLKASLDKLVEKQKLSREEADGILSRIHFESDLTRLHHCNLVIEAIVENLDIKKKLFVQLEGILHPACILASNTSSLSIASIAAACTDAGRVVGIHFFNPATLMPLVEIIPAITTRAETAADCKQLIASWGKVTVMAKDTPGFIVNRVARSFYGESIRICEEGIASMPTIDWALKTYGGFRMGPFELMDFIGNDINYKVTESVWEQFFYEPRFKPSLTQKRLYEAGLFGRKTGKGYYSYAEGSVMQEPVKDESLGMLIFNRVISMLINEAADSLYLQVATREDIDLAMTKGVNYPKGLLKWADELGTDFVLHTLEHLHDEYQEERYRPSLLLKTMGRNKKKFYE
ncbi:MAG TPA: 3-hydroxyacyl-CoA dehydrogenase NAD-binding domain-containing protein [Bacteroidia bacterium]|nr:3-hydroxyacyl-CoA dehydrogenase NAD-binding domain-containing protein [Bacteroidia bacterium]